MATPSPFLSLHARKTWYTQNIQNDCHQWFSDSFGVHKIRFRIGLRPEPTGGMAPPDLLAGFKGQETGDQLPFRKFLDSPLYNVPTADCLFRPSTVTCYEAGEVLRQGGML